MKKKCKEVIDCIIPKFFEVSFYNLKYYDLILTNKRLLLVWMGESYKTWMLRVDPGINKRKDFENLDIDEIIKNHENSIVLDLDDIKAIQFHKRTFFKNARLNIKTIDKEYKFYSRDKEVNSRNFLKSFEELLNGKIIIDN